MAGNKDFEMTSADYNAFSWLQHLELTEETIVYRKPNSVLYDRTLLSLDSEFDLSVDPFKIKRATN